MDPKKRLQVQRTATPSLRLSVAPKKSAQLTAEGSKTPVQVSGTNKAKQGVVQPRNTTNPVDAAGRFLFDNTAKVVNSTVANARQVPDTIRQAVAGATGDQAAFRAATERLNQLTQKNFGDKGGLFDAGTVVNADEYRNGSTADLARKFGGTYVKAAATEIAPWFIGGTGSLTAKTLEKSTAKGLGLAGAGGAGLGAIGSIAGQVADNGKVDAKQVATDTGLAGVFGVVGAGAQKLFGKLAGKIKAGKKLTPKETAQAESIQASTGTPVADTHGIAAPRTTPGSDVDFRLMFNGPAKTVATTNSPKIGKAIARAYTTTGSQDPTVLAMHALAHTDDKATVRDIVNTLVPGMDNATQNTVVRNVQKIEDPADVGDYLWEVAHRKGSGSSADVPITPQSVTETQNPSPTGNARQETIAPNGARIVTNEPTNANNVTNQATGIQANEPSPQAQPLSHPITDTPVPGATTTDVAAANIAPADGAPALTKKGDPRADGKTALPNKNIENASDETRSAVDAVLGVLGDASKVASKNAKTLSQSRAVKAGASEGAAKSVGGQEGYYAALSELKGATPKKTFDALKDKIDQKQVDALFSHVQNLDTLRPFEKINVQTALAKVFGSAKGAPTKGDIKLLEKTFGNEFAKAIDDNISTFQKVKEAGYELANVPRALLSAFDFSAPFRQGLVTSVRYPKEFFSNFKSMFKAFGDEKAFQLTQDSIANSKNYELMRKSGLAITDLENLDGREEQFMSNFAEKIPLVGRGVRASGRSYTAFLNKTRADIFDKLINEASSQGLNTSESNKLTKDIATFINSATGRGSLGPLEDSAKGLNAILFSPRLWASRINLINPAYYAKLEPFARKQAIQSMAGLAGAAATVLSLAKAAGAEVETDPRSSDFAKIKIGNTRYDVLGGFQQNLVLLSRMITGEKINSVTGEASTLGEGYGKPSRLDLGIDFLKNKLNPVAGFGAKLAEGKQPNGDPLNVPAEFGRLFVPLNAQDAKDLYDERGPLGVLMAAPGLLGFGSNTYGDRTTNDGAEPTLGTNIEKGSNGSGSLSVASVDNVKPVTGEKGKTLEDTLRNQKKAESDAVAAYKKNLSTTDKSLLAANKNDLDALRKDKKISPEQYDRSQKLKDNVAKLKGTYKEKEVKIPEGVKSTNATTFYKKYQSLSTDERKKWLASDKVDGSAKKIAEDVNKQRPAGLPEFKATNQLAKDYADFEDKTNTKGATDIDKRNALKSFLSKSVKNQYSEGAKDIFAEGNSNDFKTLLDDGKITKEDMEQAIAIDNALYESGVNATLRFSKKARKDLGYGLPKNFSSKSGGSSSSSSSSGSGSSVSKRAYLSSYLADFKALTKPPTADTTPRKVALKQPALPRTGNKAKISIRL
jgi:hypothetical protein